jgi:SAM-dependent methyltransferase
LKLLRSTLTSIATLCCIVAATTGAALAETSQQAFQPVVGQEGKDVVWVPTPPKLVEKMLDMAAVTPQDYVIDLGSGDGRNVIAAAKRGARALGVEYNPNMVELSSRSAAAEGVADKATFVQGDMYEADISQATVLALFLLPENLRKLTPKFLALRPGTRIVANHFGIEGWDADETERTDGECPSWCTALLYIVPAKVAGKWRLGDGELALDQKFQRVSGTLTSSTTSAPIENGRLRGDQISFSVNGAEYAGRVKGDTMQVNVKGSSSGQWTATRAGS